MQADSLLSETSVRAPQKLARKGEKRLYSQDKFKTECKTLVLLIVWALKNCCICSRFLLRQKDGYFCAFLPRCCLQGNGTHISWRFLRDAPRLTESEYLRQGLRNFFAKVSGGFNGYWSLRTSVFKRAMTHELREVIEGARLMMASWRPALSAAKTQRTGKALQRWSCKGLEAPGSPSVFRWSSEHGGNLPKLHNSIRENSTLGSPDSSCCTPCIRKWEHLGLSQTLLERNECKQAIWHAWVSI